MKLNKNVKVWAEFTVQPNGQLKVKVAKKLTKLNQYKTLWKQVPSREFARALNQSNLVTR